MGIAHNSQFLVWFEIGRTELLRDLGLAYRELEQRGVMLPLRESGIKYLKPVHYDDVLTVVTRLGDIFGIRLRLDYTIMHGMDVMATGFTEHVFADASLRPVRPPKDVVALLNDTHDGSKHKEDTKG